MHHIYSMQYVILRAIYYIHYIQRSVVSLAALFHTCFTKGRVRQSLPASGEMFSWTLAIRTTVVPITPLIGTTVVRISGVIRTTGKSISKCSCIEMDTFYVDKYITMAFKTETEYYTCRNFLLFN